MKNILWHLISATVLICLLTTEAFSSASEWCDSADDKLRLAATAENKLLNPPDCTCNRTADSLVLVELYNSTNGIFWDNNWLFFMPMSSWTGVVLGANGCVERLELSSNNLSGTLPASIGNLTCLTLLHVDNNNLSGTIPPEIGNLSNLSILFLDNNQFFGTIPLSFGNLSNLQTLFLDNNCITGGVPVTFQSLTNLQTFDFFYNKIDNVPDLTGLPLQRNKFRVHHNKLTFDDLVPYTAPIDLSMTPVETGPMYDDYYPQDSIFQTTYLTFYTGDYAEVDLGIDELIPDNEYIWYKNGSYHSGPININKLIFDPVDWNVPGTYNCVVTNPRAPNLTLYSRDIHINVLCGQSIYELNDTICDGASYLINGTVYDASNPTGTENLTFSGVVDIYGCDTIVEVNLTVYDPVMGNYTPVICPGQSINYNGTIYDSANMTGTETLANASYLGCDSTVLVNLSFHTIETGFYSPIICAGESLSFNGTVYDISNMTGTETLIDSSYLGCDSIVNVSLSFYPEVTGNYSPVICPGTSLTFNGTIYDASNMIGTETLVDSSYLGCDSIVEVSLSFHPEVIGDYTETLCNGSSLVINGTVYNATNPTGTENLGPIGANNCDSIVNITIDFHPISVGNLFTELCTGQSIIVNGNTYDFNTPSGTEVLQDSSATGCDSIVFINLTFSPALSENIFTTLCPDDFIIANGVVYDASNPSGSEFMPNGSEAGCDSTVFINLDFHPEAIGYVDTLLCNGESLTINGTVYNQANPTGTELQTDGSPNFCDSTIFVNLSFYPPAVNNYTTTICADESIDINGTFFDINTPTGSVIIPTIAQGGCDSTVNVTLNFYPPAENFINGNYCNGQSFIYNGTVYDKNNPTGTEVLTNGSSNGCDSTLFIDLNFTPNAAVAYSPMICPGASIVINGTTYDASNMTGTEIFFAEGPNDCDSTVNVTLGIHTTIPNNIDTTLCPGNSIVIQGTTYDESNLSGSHVIEGVGQFGCDSTINVSVSYYDAPETTLNMTLCNGQSIEVNGTTYDMNNVSGTEIMQTNDGCDSTIMILLEFTSGYFTDINPTLCEGESVMVNNIEYNQNNPAGTEFFPSGSQEGCDSTVTVNLSYHEPVVVDYAPQLCEGDEVIVNGTLYNEANPSGTEIFQDATTNGCDSTVNIDLTFVAPAQGMLDTTICNDAALLINGVIYDFSNPAGTEIFPLASSEGCDSVLTIQLQFFMPEAGVLDTTICPGENLIFNGTTYNIGNPSGTEILENVSSNFCDSTVNVNVSFYPVPETLLNQTLCFGEEIVVNNVVYSQNNPTGMEIIANSSQNGCDSIVNIDLQFSSAATMLLNPVLCEADEIIVNGTTYNFNNPTGTELFEQATPPGCDSIVEISLNFHIPEPFDYTETICAGDSVLFNGTVYNESNPTGTEILQGIAFNGCDSVVNVSLVVLNHQENNLTLSLCPGEVYELNGVIYDNTNSSGTENLGNISSNGCDSIVNLILNYHPEVEANYEPTICFGESVVVNGNIYNASNPAGTEIFSLATSNNCDSTVHVNLNILNENIANIDQSLCTGDFIVINGTTYDEANPAGTEFMQGGDSNGCDSTVIINLSFSNEVINNINPTLCTGESIEVNGVIYDEGNPAGMEMVAGGSTSGCDSSVVVALSFYDPEVMMINQTLCPGESIEVNNVVYDQNNSEGTETLAGAALFGCDSIVVITLVFFEITTTNIDTTLCPGESIEINGEIFNNINTAGQQNLTSQDGCDSILVIAIAYYEPIVTTIDLTLCNGQSLLVNGTSYDESNPSGTEVMTAQNGCDSTININLQFNSFSQYNIQDVLCEDEEIEVEGTIYNITNPSGMHTLPGASAAGCDSVIVVDLSFNLFSYFDLNETICPDESIEVNGTIYDIDNTEGTEILNNANANGCDSIINITLNFHAPALHIIEDILCPEASITVNGNVYDINQPDGVEEFANADSNGCDSTVIIALIFYAEAFFNYETTICQTDSVTINGTVYNFTNPAGTELLENQSSNGCDSIIDVNLSFFEPSTGIYEATICQGDFVEINGNIYNFDNPAGLEILSGMSAQGCDSLLNVQLDFHAEAIQEITDTYCSGISVMINGTTYDQDNPQGIELLENGSINGCDSTINVSLQFTDAIPGFVEQSICAGMNYELHGQTFAEAGDYQIDLPGAGSMGCDSTVMLTLLVMDESNLPPAKAGPDATICGGDYILMAEPAEGTTGYWSILEGSGVIANPDMAVTEITGITGDIMVSWIISNDICTDYATDSLSILTASAPDAENDNFEFSSGIDPVFEFNVLSNDIIPFEEPYSIEMLTNPAAGTLQAMGDGFYQLNIAEDFDGTLSFDYKLCLTDCPELCNTATVKILVNSIALPVDSTVNIPNAITPNDDGVNESFVIDMIETASVPYKDNELIVFNRWGDIVYTAKPYNNDWSGQNMDGSDLPSGTYYYILKLNLADGLIFRGDVTILK